MSETNNIDHKTLGVEDRLWLAGELEHQRRHQLKKAAVVTDKGKAFKALVLAAEATSLRRRVEHQLGQIASEDWCALKSAVAIKQLNYETMIGDTDLFKDIESFTNQIVQEGLGVDISDCRSCHEDMER